MTGKRMHPKSWVSTPMQKMPMNLGNGRRATKHVPPAPTSPKQAPKNGGRS